MQRLRWQLTLSHLIAIAFTLVSMVAALAVLASVWMASQDNPSRRTVNAARIVAAAISGLVQDASPQDLDAVLRVMASGRLRLTGANGPPQGAPFGDVGLAGASYIVAVDTSGQVLASSRQAGPSGEEKATWARLAEQALVDQHDAPVVQQGNLSLGAAPVTDGSGRPIAAVIVAVPGGAQNDRPMLWPLAFFGVATLAVLVGASVFALIASSVVGYLLSRRLVSRLEQLGKAAEALRSGDLAARVPETGQDEVSQLQRSFNSMAAQLEGTMGELAAERDRVTALLESRRQLVASVSHELRTPVATVRGYLESALRRDGTLALDLKSDLDTADREVARLEGLIDDLFTLARVEVGRLELRPVPTDIGALVRNQVETQAPLAWRQRQVQLLAEAPADGPVAEVDPRRVAQVLSNLISNAVRHTPPGGLVAVQVTPESDGLRIEVRDTGEGIPPGLVPFIWQRFHRGRDGGAGLGLTLVKELTESMGGHVEVDSTPGEGSTFSVQLPAYHPPR
jgi:signal transduction histidine kinase